MALTVNEAPEADDEALVYEITLAVVERTGKLVFVVADVVFVLTHCRHQISAPLYILIQDGTVSHLRHTSNRVQSRRLGRHGTKVAVVCDDIQLGVDTGVDVELFRGLNGARIGRAKLSNEFENVDVQADLGSSPNERQACLGGGLQTETQVSLEGGLAGRDGDGKSLGRDSLAAGEFRSGITWFI
jgi:hypothetical protein